MMTELSFWG